MMEREEAAMTELEKLWRTKTDDELAEATSEIGDFTPQAQRVIREELESRGIEFPSKSETPENLQPSDEGGDAGAQLPSIACLRCKEPMEYQGTKRFHEGTNWGVLGELGEIFVNRERFDIYVCPLCGKVEF